LLRLPWVVAPIFQEFFQEHMATVCEFVKNDEQPDPREPKKTIVFYVLSFFGREVSKQFSDFEALKAQLTQVGFRAANSRDPGGPTGPLDTRLRTPSTLSRKGKCHTKRLRPPA
jgi:hypothetical protein